VGEPAALEGARLGSSPDHLRALRLRRSCLLLFPVRWLRSMSKSNSGCSGETFVKKSLAFSFVFLALLLAAQLMAQAAPPFSADIIMHSQRGDMSGKFFSSPTKTRMDMQTPGGSVSNITDMPGKKFYLVMHDR